VHKIAISYRELDVNSTLNLNSLATWQNKPKYSLVSDEAFKYLPGNVYFRILFSHSFALTPSILATPMIQVAPLTKLPAAAKPTHSFLAHKYFPVPLGVPYQESIARHLPNMGSIWR
jgi:hypothetical protein